MLMSIFKGAAAFSQRLALSSEAQGSSRRVAGLDTLRVVAALWVAMSHGARFPFQELFDSGSSLHILTLANNATFNGVAAVFVFFVISGFVVHYPYVRAARIDVVPFLVRRGLRVGIPAIIIILLTRWLGDRYQAVEEMVLWSVYCELIYYGLYPLLFRLSKRVGLRRMVLVSLMPAVGLAVWQWKFIYFSELRVLEAAAIGLPTWLAGCALAEELGTRQLSAPFAGRRTVIAYRVGALLLAIILKSVAGHGPLIIGFPQSHWVFGVFCFFWMRTEIAGYQERPPHKALEWAGRWSYSLYLTHFPILIFFQQYFAEADVFAVWVAQTVSLVVCAYVFYLGVERPSHLFARHAGRIAKTVGRLISTPRRPDQVGERSAEKVPTFS